MSWIILNDTCVLIDSEQYIKSQPVSFDQISDVIEKIRLKGLPVDAQINVKGLCISRVDIVGVMNLIWRIHEEMYGENLLRSIELVNASPNIFYIWNKLLPLIFD